MARGTVVTGGAAMTMVVVGKDQRLWASKSRQLSSGWSSLVLQAGSFSISSASGDKVRQVPQVLPATDQAGEAAVEVGVDLTTMMTHLHHMTTKDGQEKARMEQTSLRVGDLDHGLPRWVVPPLGMPLDVWATEATRPTVDGVAIADGVVTVVGGTMETVVRDPRLDLGPASPTPGTRALVLARLREGRHVGAQMKNILGSK